MEHLVNVCTWAAVSHLFITQTVYGQTGTQVKALRTQLFVTDTYDYRVRPVSNQSLSTDVYVDFYLLNINGLDEVTETLKTTGYLFIAWEDNFLAWNASDYGNLEHIFLPQGDIWKPDVALKNSFTKYQELGVPSLNVKIYSSGMVQWIPFQVFESTCSIDITYFPFDLQKCSLTFVAWSYSYEEVFMYSGSKGINLEEFETNSNWDVESSSWALLTESNQATITFNINLRRKPLYSMLTLVLPVLLLAILNLNVFMLPCESGERAGFAVTVFLAFAVFLTILETTLPKNSEKVAMFSVYVIIQTIQSTLITTVALTMLRCTTFGEKTKIPKCLIALAKVSKLKSCRKNKVQAIKDEEVEDETKDDKQNDVIREDTKIYTWKEIVNCLDILCFIFFSLVVVISTIAFFIAAAKPS